MVRARALFRRIARSGVFAAAFFSLSLVFFLDRGPYRALRGLRTGDFVMIYAPSRSWLHQRNPYVRKNLNLALIQAGTPAEAIREQDLHLFTYPISLLPIVATIAWLPWTAANLTWCLLSLGCFAGSIVILVRTFASLSARFSAAGCCLFFSPAYVGILNGNPSVPAISMTILCLYFAQLNRFWISGVLFAIALCVKPQIALCSVLAFLFWRRWSALFIGFGTATVITLFSGLWISSFGHDWQWWESLKHNAASLAEPGSLIDPRPSSPYANGFLNLQALSYLLAPNAALGEIFVLLLTASLVILYFYRRRNESAPNGWIDPAFFAAVTLGVAYHRYYDAQLLIVLIPAIAWLWSNGSARSAWALGLCLTLLAFPSQSFFSKLIEPTGTHLSLLQILLFRHQPAAVAAIALILSGTRASLREGQPACFHILTP